MGAEKGANALATESDGPDAVRAFEEGLPVRLIATPRSEFKTCDPDEELEAITASNGQDFDYLPVVEREKIIGLLKLVDRTDYRGRVREQMVPLSESNLIGADASILTFIRGADEHGCRLVISGERIFGLVSLADLHRLPVRAALFGIITQLEGEMIKAIQREFDNSNDWTRCLSPKRQEDIDNEVANAKKEDVFVNKLLFTQFCDKVTILKKICHLPCSKGKFENNLEQVQSLRNKVAHANDYATTHKEARQVCETVRLIDQWIKWLAS